MRWLFGFSHKSCKGDIRRSIIYRWKKETEALGPHGMVRCWVLHRSISQLCSFRSIRTSQQLQPGPAGISSIWSEAPSGELGLFSAILLLSVLRWQGSAGSVRPPWEPSVSFYLFPDLCCVQRARRGSRWETIVSHLGHGRPLLAAHTLLRAYLFSISSTPG